MSLEQEGFTSKSIIYGPQLMLRVAFSFDFKVVGRLEGPALKSPGEEECQGKDN